MYEICANGPTHVQPLLKGQSVKQCAASSTEDEYSNSIYYSPFTIPRPAILPNSTHNTSLLTPISQVG
jgi:hypothetical protein